MFKILTAYAMTMIMWCLLSEQWNLYKHINILKLCKTNITCNVTCFPCTWRHQTFHFTVLFQMELLKCNVTCFPRTWRHFPRNIFPYFFYKSSILSQNLFLLSILQHFIASKSNHIIYTMLPNEMVLAPLQKLKIKYELSYQSNTKLKYIDKFDQLLIIHQLTCTVDNTVRSLIHFTIFI